MSILESMHVAYFGHYYLEDVIARRGLPHANSASTLRIRSIATALAAEDVKVRIFSSCISLRSRSRVVLFDSAVHAEIAHNVALYVFPALCIRYLGQIAEPLIVILYLVCRMGSFRGAVGLVYGFT